MILFFAGVFASCKTTADDEGARPVPAEAGLKVINTTTATINYYINGTRQNTESYIYPAGATNYIGVTSGEQSYNFKQVIGSGNFTDLFSTTLTLKEDTYNSLFVTGGSTSQLILTQDDFNTETGNFAQVRFVHTSPDIAALDVKVGDTVAFTNRSFKAVSPFTKVGSGRKKLNISLAGSNTPQLSGIVILLPGRVYTIYTKGALNGTGANAFSTGLVINQ
jgi:hypothetical protein